MKKSTDIMCARREVILVDSLFDITLYLLLNMYKNIVVWLLLKRVCEKIFVCQVNVLNSQYFA